MLSMVNQEDELQQTNTENGPSRQAVQGDGTHPKGQMQSISAAHGPDPQREGTPDDKDMPSDDVKVLESTAVADCKQGVDAEETRGQSQPLPVHAYTSGDKQPQLGTETELGLAVMREGAPVPDTDPAQAAECTDRGHNAAQECSATSVRREKISEMGPTVPAANNVDVKTDSPKQDVRQAYVQQVDEAESISHPAHSADLQQDGGLAREQEDAVGQTEDLPPDDVKALESTGVADHEKGEDAQETHGQSQHVPVQPPAAETHSCALGEQQVRDTPHGPSGADQQESSNADAAAFVQPQLDAEAASGVETSDAVSFSIDEKAEPEGGHVLKCPATAVADQANLQQHSSTCDDARRHSQDGGLAREQEDAVGQTEDLPPDDVKALESTGVADHEKGEDAQETHGQSQHVPVQPPAAETHSCALGEQQVRDTPHGPSGADQQESSNADAAAFVQPQLDAEAASGVETSDAVSFSIDEKAEPEGGHILKCPATAVADQANLQQHSSTCDDARRHSQDGGLAREQEDAVGQTEDLPPDDVKALESTGVADHEKGEDAQETHGQSQHVPVQPPAAETHSCALGEQQVRDTPHGPSGADQQESSNADAAAFVQPQLDAEAAPVVKTADAVSFSTDEKAEQEGGHVLECPATAAADQANLQQHSSTCDDARRHSQDGALACEQEDAVGQTEDLPPNDVKALESTDVADHEKGEDAQETHGQSQHGPVRHPPKESSSAQAAALFQPQLEAQTQLGAEAAATVSYCGIDQIAEREGGEVQQECLPLTELETSAYAGCSGCVEELSEHDNLSTLSGPRGGKPCKCKWHARYATLLWSELWFYYGCRQCRRPRALRNGSTGESSGSAS